MSITENFRPTAVASVTGDEQNPYLLGIYAPVHEEISAEDMVVIGEIPKDLNGVYLRNGPNRRYEAPGRYSTGSLKTRRTTRLATVTASTSRTLPTPT